MSGTLLICGGRDFNDHAMFDRELIACCNQHGPFDRWIAGGAHGADSLARSYANAWEVPFTEYPADWKRLGKRAGFERNTRMLNDGKPRVVLAFPGGVGTAMMVRIARAAGVLVIEPRP